MSRRADEEIAKYLSESLYHPRSSKHGDKMCELLLLDLLAGCKSFADAARQRRIVYRPNYTVDPDSPNKWNIDLVVGPPAGPDIPDRGQIGLIAKGDPKAIWMAVDAKTIMTVRIPANLNSDSGPM